MDKKFALMSMTSSVDPGELGINLRFKGNQVVHPRSRAAQEFLIQEIKSAIGDRDMDFGEETGVAIEFTFSSRRFDIDGPIKRTIDALGKALKAKDIAWNDNRVCVLNVDKNIDRDYPHLELTVWKVR